MNKVRKKLNYKKDQVGANIQENIIQEKMPEILDILLIDRTKSTKGKKKNIIWANENYKKYGFSDYSLESEIKPNVITGSRGQIIMPRALKSQEIQKERTKSKAEVFTPIWIVKKQNDQIDLEYKKDSLEKYVNRLWIEIACGEGPYMTTRYDVENGNIIEISERVGFVDRKLKRINKEVKVKEDWGKLVKDAFKASYGFEWSGDSLLLARENLLYTFRDFYYDKWLEEPPYQLFKDIANIISYNVFQMDGLNYTIPLSEKKEKIVNQQISLFDDEITEEKWFIKPGTLVKIMNWKTNKMERFSKGVK
ncbi:hypothetical protein AP1H75_02940 [Apilactobacillus apinorum]|uniref:restriction endonuclease n=1 Tax=Apilactobacillus apinorum TaxID=1218495 RepID=UPI0030E9C14B